MPELSAMPPSPVIGDVHLDQSTQTWWVYFPIDINDEDKGGYWTTQEKDFAFQSPFSGTSQRYTWNMGTDNWLVHSSNKHPVAPTMKDVRVSDKLIIALLYS